MECSRLAGDIGLFGGFYTVRFQLGEAVGRSVMYACAGKMLGGNSAFAHIGTYEDLGGEVAIEPRSPLGTQITARLPLGRLR